MSNACTHTTEPYYDILFPETAQVPPSPEEINKARLWQCQDCGKWFSHLGLTADSKNYLNQEI